jgi:uracil-DNA glycosylase
MADYRHIRPMPAEPLEDLLERIRGCTHCAQHFSHAPRPTLRADARARILIVGQAPGSRVHATGIPWNDRSGDRLRDWLALDRDRFYDGRNIAVVPMGFCYPGVDRHGGDKPPRRECAPKWHEPVLAAMPRLQLTLLVGSYAQKHYLKEYGIGSSMTETVRRWREFLPRFMPLPHPSWRNTAWLRRNPWFEAELMPELRERVAEILAG